MGGEATIPSKRRKLNRSDSGERWTIFTDDELPERMESSLKLTRRTMKGSIELIPYELNDLTETIDLTLE